jgi:hypothetical protein
MNINIINNLKLAVIAGVEPAISKVMDDHRLSAHANVLYYQKPRGASTLEATTKQQQLKQ